MVRAFAGDSTITNAFPTFEPIKYVCTCMCLTIPETVAGSTRRKSRNNHTLLLEKRRFAKGLLPRDSGKRNSGAGNHQFGMPYSSKELAGRPHG